MLPSISSLTHSLTHGLLTYVFVLSTASSQEGFTLRAGRKISPVTEERNGSYLIPPEITQFVYHRPYLNENRIAGFFPFQKCGQKRGRKEKTFLFPSFGLNFSRKLLKAFLFLLLLVLFGCGRRRRSFSRERNGTASTNLEELWLGTCFFSCLSLLALLPPAAMAIYDD